MGRSGHGRKKMKQVLLSNSELALLPNVLAAHVRSSQKRNHKSSVEYDDPFMIPNQLPQINKALISSEDSSKRSSKRSSTVEKIEIEVHDNTEVHALYGD